MKEKQLEAFLKTIDKIVSGEPVKPSEYQQYDEEDKELLFLAQVLAENDFSRQKSKLAEDELTEDELDLVAGGIKPDVISDRIRDK